MTLALAIDLGGTKVESALVDPAGRIVEGSRHRVPTGDAVARDVQALGDAISEVVHRCSAHSQWPRVTAAGIGSAGPIDVAEGTVSPINLPAARGYRIVDRVKQASRLDDVTLRLDGTCIALAETWLGAARGIANALIMVVSTGVGGGIISDGRLIVGNSGNAGHIGQLLIRDPDDDLAAASVEGISSGPRTVAWARRQGWRGTTGEELATAFRQGVPQAVAAVERSARAVALGVINATTLLDLELAVIGGGFASVADTYTEMVQAGVRANSINAYSSRLIVVPATLGSDAPLIGAAALVHRADLL